MVTSHRPLILDPLFNDGDRGVSAVGALLYRGLLTFDDRAATRPDLADAVAVSPDGLTLQLHLRPGQVWSDGRPITTGDAATTIAVVQRNSAVENRLHAAWQGVAVTVNPSTITLHLPAPRGSMVTSLAELPILPLGAMAPAQLSALPGELTAPLPTSGAYRVDASDQAGLRLTANAHAVTPPRFNRIELRPVAGDSAAEQAFLGGDVDGVLATDPGEAQRLGALPGAIHHVIRTFRFVDAIFNERLPGLDDPVVRHAMAAAVDRRQIIDSALGGQATAETGPFPAAMEWLGGLTGSAPRADPVVARAMLDAAGWHLGADGVRSRGATRLAFTLDVPATDPLPAVARTVATQIRSTGIAVTVSVHPSGSFLAAVMAAGAFQIAIADWDAGPDPDVSAFWRSTATPPHGYNVSGSPPDPFLDRALDSLATMSDAGARTTAAATATRQLTDDAPAVFLYTPSVDFVTRSGFTSIVVPASGDGDRRFADVATWR